MEEEMEYGVFPHEKEPRVSFVDRDDLIEVTLDFTGQEDKKSQLTQYCETFNTLEVATLLNLKYWAKNRNIPCNIKTTRKLGLSNLLCRLLIVTYPHARDSFPPVKWGEKIK